VYLFGTRENYFLVQVRCKFNDSCSDNNYFGCFLSPNTINREGNRMAWLNKIIILGLFLTILWTGHSLFVLTHENIHKQVNTNYGLDSTITFNTFGLFAQTIPNTNCANQEACIESIHDQSMVEIIGYTAYPFFLLFLLTIDFVACIWLYHKNESI